MSTFFSFITLSLFTVCMYFVFKSGIPLLNHLSYLPMGDWLEYLSDHRILVLYTLGVMVSAWGSFSLTVMLIVASINK